MGIQGEWWVLLKIPRGDINGVGEDEVTVTSGLHAQAERTKKQKREEKAASSGGAGRDPGPEDGAQARGRAAARGRERGRRGFWAPFLRQTCLWSPTSAICVQSFDDSLNSAIRTTYRISLRSSSLREPRYPLLKVVKVF